MFFTIPAPQINFAASSRFEIAVENLEGRLFEETFRGGFASFSQAEVRSQRSSPAELATQTGNKSAPLEQKISGGAGKGRACEAMPNVRAYHILCCRTIARPEIPHGSSASYDRALLW